MADLMYFVNRYREATDLDERKSASRTLYELLEGELRLFVRGKMPPSVRDDVLQEIFISIFTNLSKFRGDKEKAFRKWYYQIAWRRVQDQYRKQYANPLQPHPLEELLQMEKDRDIGASWAGAGMFTMTVSTADLEEGLSILEGAKPGCRQLLWDYYIVGFEYDEIATQLQVEYDTARRRIERCLKAAQKLLAEQYGK